MKTFALICLRLFSSVGQGLFLCIEADVNHLHCSKRSSGGWWMFIASERPFGSFILNTVVFCLGTGVALKHISFTTSSDLPAGPVVSCDRYSICHVGLLTLRGDMHSANDSIDVTALWLFIE